MAQVVYLFDIDIIERSTYPSFPKLPNHALCKFTDYYKKKGYEVKLIYRAKDIPHYDKNNIYIGSALYTPNLNRFKKRLQLIEKYKKEGDILHITDIHIGTPLDFCPITDEENVKCDYSLYDKMVKEGVKLAWYPRNIGFLTRHCIRRCAFCINRNRNEIRQVNRLEDIYQIPNTQIELLDDNLFSAPNVTELLHHIGDFYKENKVKIRLQNGLDCREVTDEKIKALAYAAPAFNEMYSAWDNVHNTFIYRNLNRLRINVKIPYWYTYILFGDKVRTKEEFKKDLLGFYYRVYLLLKLNIKPVGQLFDDDTQNYFNPYLTHYKVLSRQYPETRLGTMNSLYRNLPPHLTGYANEIKEVLGEFGYLTEPIWKLLNSPTFEDSMQDIADYLNIKHYPHIPRQNNKKE